MAIGGVLILERVRLALAFALCGEQPWRLAMGGERKCWLASSLSKEGEVLQTVLMVVAGPWLPRRSALEWCPTKSSVALLLVCVAFLWQAQARLMTAGVFWVLGGRRDHCLCRSSGVKSSSVLFSFPLPVFKFKSVCYTLEQVPCALLSRSW